MQAANLGGPLACLRAWGTHCWLVPSRWTPHPTPCTLHLISVSEAECPGPPDRPRRRHFSLATWAGSQAEVEVASRARMCQAVLPGKQPRLLTPPQALPWMTTSLRVSELGPLLSGLGGIWVTCSLGPRHPPPPLSATHSSAKGVSLPANLFMQRDTLSSGIPTYSLYHHTPYLTGISSESHFVQLQCRSDQRQS